MGDRLDPLFENHLAFLSTHRGRVGWTETSVSVDGDIPSLSSWTPFGDDAEIPDGCQVARLIPASGPTWSDRLTARGLKPAETLSYMELVDLSGVADTPPDAVEITRVATNEEAKTFAEIQAAGFLDESDEDPETIWWRRHFVAMALRNYRREDQSFFIATVNSVPASVLLSVHTPGMTGIYAVATAPHFRRRSLSAILLRKACAEARAYGNQHIGLQAMTGSYAHEFYGRRGFRDRYASQLWRSGLEEAQSD
jgi:GNAT superfamily N-acetyltransferase